MTAAAAPPTIPVTTPDQFVGSAACAECHRTDFDSHRRSRHAQTLKVMSREGLGRLAPAEGAIPGTGLFLAHHGGRFGIGLAAHPAFVLPLDYALGSGKTGMTYVSVVNDGTVAEIRTSYFPPQKQWHTTPGDESLATGALARLLSPDDARTCFHCHAVMPSQATVVPARKFFGVGCENCHGPGGAHLTLMRAGKYDQDQMEDLKRRPAPQLIELCGQCHGSAQAALTGSAPVSTDQANRFEPLGLAQSQCFRHSAGALSCLSCHDSHTDVSTNSRAYNAVCLSCHTAAATRRPPPLRTATVKLCAVGPNGRCISCHMPKQKVMAFGSIPTVMSDHFIRVHR